MDAATIIDTLTPLVTGASFEVGKSVDMPTVYVPADRLLETARALRDTPALGFNVLVEVTAADYLPRAPRYEVVYHLLSVRHRGRLRVKVRLADGEAIPTVQDVWKSAGWPEREVYDMFGIVFTDHPDLRRILMPEDWDGHPARKDYPVQIRKTAQTYEPLEISEDEFRANIERDRVKRTH
ncbi:MAG TPA: NADH-quinone oxidoreductase subunit C [Vicinamibacterales bacterium]|nr:NADH-quinone oxidoreductase subunit C [Vicinamibacterales bacterium]